MNRLGVIKILDCLYVLPSRFAQVAHLTPLRKLRQPPERQVNIPRRIGTGGEQMSIEVKSSHNSDCQWTQHGHMLRENFLQAARSITYSQDHSGIPKNDQLVALEMRLGHIFTHRSLLNLALTHRSAGSPNSRVLSWMGDAALQMAVTEQLAGMCGCTSVGDLTTLRCELVSRESCRHNATDLGLENLMVFGKGVMVANKGKPSNDMMAEAFEAVIGAVYVDGGLDAVRKAYGRNFPLSQDILSKIS